MLQVKNICKRYKKNVLNNISFEVCQNEIVGIIGANGSGKSTLVSIIMNNTKRDNGEVFINGTNVFLKNFNMWHLVGYVPQENVLFNKLTALENISFWAKAYKVKHENLYFDNKFLHEKVENLSVGNKKMLSIELALLHNPKYLIMDEPTSGLDLVNQEKVINLIIDYKKKGNSILFITHHINEIKICDKLVVLQEGNLAYFDKPQNIFSNDNDIVKTIIGGEKVE